MPYTDSYKQESKTEADGDCGWLVIHCVNPKDAEQKNDDFCSCGEQREAGDA